MFDPLANLKFIAEKSYLQGKYFKNQVKGKYVSGMVDALNTL